MNKIEILNQIKSLKLENAKILDTIASEEREATNVETLTMENNTLEIRSLEDEIKNFKANDEKGKKVEVKEERGISLVKFLNGVKNNGKFDEDLLEQVKMAERNFVDNISKKPDGYALPLFDRGLAAGTSTGGAEVISEDKLGLLTGLKNNLIFSQVGATIMTGLKGNLNLPVYTTTTAYWKGENVSMADGAGTFSEVEMTPKRLTVLLPVSNQLLIQSTPDVEAKLKEDMIYAIKNKLEATFLGTATGTTFPSGIFSDASYDVSGSTTWANVVELESVLSAANANIGNLAYIVHPTTIGKMKTTQRGASNYHIVEDNSLLNGYKYVSSNNIPAISTGKGILFGNFRDLYICQWGSLDIMVDPYTSAKEGITNFLINSYWDVKLIRDASVAKGWLS